jgi:soluble lytic murein transglycosylase
MNPAKSPRPPSTAQVKRQAASAARRSVSRRPPPRRKRKVEAKPKRGRKRTIFAVAGTVLLGAAIGFIVTNPEKFEETLREVTLPLRHEDIIRQQAQDKGVEAPLIAAIIYVESHFRDQTSSAGARGLMQITPNTAKEIEKLSGGKNFEYDDLADPDLNIRYGTFYIRHLLNQYEGNEVAAVAAYNAGPAKVHEWGAANMDTDDIDFPETRDYVEKVLDKRDDYRSHYSEELGL